jgi:hypothetical protein
MEKVCYAVVEDEGRCVFSSMEDEGRGMADDAVERGRSALVRRCRSGGIERPRS